MSTKFTMHNLATMTDGLRIAQDLRYTLKAALRGIDHTTPWDFKAQKSGDLHWKAGCLESGSSYVEPWVYTSEYPKDGVRGGLGFPLLVVWFRHCRWPQRRLPRPWRVLDNGFQDDDLLTLQAPLRQILHKADDPVAGLRDAIGSVVPRLD